MRAYLVGKGRSLDAATPGWFGADGPVYCINQTATPVRRLLPDRDVVCVQNDAWVSYRPPDDVRWLCTASVATGDHPAVDRYVPEQLTGKWGSPTCVCALELLKRAGYREIVMVGFDSYFDGSREYADCLDIKSDGIAPYHFYNTMMRRWAALNDVRLLWADSSGVGHESPVEFSKCLVAVAMGDRYIRQTEGMVASFLRHNPTWAVERFYDAAVAALLPSPCRSWSPFNQVELGRWAAMNKCLDKYDSVLYADGDIRWYSPYESEFSHTIVLCPHYITGKAKNSRKHWIMKDGAANIGIVEINRSIECDGVFDFIINEVLHRPAYFMHGDQLWLQNIVSTLPDCGYDCVYNRHPGMDVASWNLNAGDRDVFEDGGRYMVRTDNGETAPLVSMHFSAKSLHSLAGRGGAVSRLVSEYMHE